MNVQLPSYLEQSSAVRARFERIKAREVILEVKHLGKTFRRGTDEVAALRDISFQTHRREFVCIIGPSGCGKSTLARILAGLEPHSSGTVLLDGTPIAGPGRDRGMVFQGYTLFPWLSVKRNVMFGLEVNGMDAAAAAREASLWLELVGLEKFTDAYPHELSGGMKQRVAIARALVNQPRILLMDEPFGALDAQTRLQMQELLLQVWQTHRTTVLFVTHDVEEAILLSDRIYVMTARPGRIKAELRVDLARPRTLLDTESDPRFAALRKQVLTLLRAE